MSWVKFGAVLTGGAFGAIFAILSIEFFNSNISQFGYLAACAIFGGIVCAVISAGMPQHARKSGQPDLSTNINSGGRSKVTVARTVASLPPGPKTHSKFNAPATSTGQWHHRSPDHC